MANKVLTHTGNLHPRRSAFNLGHFVAYDCGFGELIPIVCEEMLPGDTFKGTIDIVGRLQSALVAPIFSQFDIVVEGFTVPLRLLMGKEAQFPVPEGETSWHEFLKGGESGDEDLPLPLIGRPDIPTYVAYFGFSDCIGIQPAVTFNDLDSIPVSYYHRAYRWIWNYFYRSEFLQDEIQVSQYLGDGSSLDTTYLTLVDSSVSDYSKPGSYDAILRRGWRRDYFTSALPFQQFGTSPAFSVEGILPVVDGQYPTSGTFLQHFLKPGSDRGINYRWNEYRQNGFTIPPYTLPADADPTDSVVQPFAFIPPSGAVGEQSFNMQQNSVNTSPAERHAERSGSGSVSPVPSVNLQDAVTFDISELRTNVQIQKWKERNARGGVRYSELLRSHFGVAPSDGMLNNPTFQFAFRGHWISHEVLQTAASSDGSTPQGNQAGQSMCVVRGSIGKIRVFEHSVFLVLASVVPKPAYQQGIPKKFTRRTRFDFYTPEFAHLSEQPIYNREIFVSGNKVVDDDIFGFTGIYNDYRMIPSRVARHMRSNAPGYSLDYWHQARLFSETPALNDDFLTIGGTTESQKELNRIFAVTSDDVAYPFVIHVGNNITGIRPVSRDAEPGLMDHF